MKCEDCLPIIEEYFDAELDVKAAEQVAAHIAGCAECGEVFESLRQEQTIYASYQRDIDVTPALWAGIKARIHQEATPVQVEKETSKPNGLFGGLRGLLASLWHVPHFSPALTAAMIIAAVGVTVAVMSYLHSRQQTTSTIAGSQPVAPPENKQTASPTQTEDNQLAKLPEKKEEPSLPQSEKEENARIRTVKASPEKAQPLPAVKKEIKQPDSNSIAEQLLHDAEKKYVAAITILKRNYDKHRSQLNAETIARFDAALDSIDRTIAATKAAVKKNPDDPIALQYMLAAYAKKVEVLKDITQGS
jgi:hypothetical protein